VATAEGTGAVTDVEAGRIGSSLEDFLAEEGILEEVQAQALKEVIAWQIEQAMAAQKLSKSAMAARMATSRAQLDRLLDPKNTSVTLHTLQKAAAAVGRRLRLELV
jgi:antitoxin HicB